MSEPFCSMVVCPLCDAAFSDQRAWEAHRAEHLRKPISGPEAAQVYLAKRAELAGRKPSPADWACVECPHVRHATAACPICSCTSQQFSAEPGRQAAPDGLSFDSKQPSKPGREPSSSTTPEGGTHA